MATAAAAGSRPLFRGPLPNGALQQPLDAPGVSGASVSVAAIRDRRRARWPTPKPFAVAWHAAQVGKVLEQVRAYPWPPAPEVADGWAYGCDAGYLQAALRPLAGRLRLARRRRTSSTAIRSSPPGSRTSTSTSCTWSARRSGKRPLILSHGWPGSHYEFWGAIDKLAWPSRHGGDGGRRLRPGDPLAARLRLLVEARAGRSASGQTARLFNTLMTEVLGYDRYLAQGGDWGSLVTSWLGLRPPDERAGHPPQHAGLSAARRPARARPRRPG